MEYCHRPNAFRQKVCYRLDGEILQIEEKDRRQTYDVARIRRIHLSYTPSRVQTTRYRMRVWLEGAPRIELSNTSYVGFANFETHDDAYTAFVRALHAALPKGGAGVRLDAGFSRLGYLAMLLFSLAVAAMLIGIVVALWNIGGSGSAYVKFGLIIFFLPVLALYLLRNRPQTYRVDDLPEDCLPG